MERQLLVVAATLLIATMVFSSASSPPLLPQTDNDSSAGKPSDPPPNPRFTNEDVLSWLRPPVSFIFPKPTEPASEPGFEPGQFPHCPHLDVRHEGFNATQQEGDIALPLEELPPTSPSHFAEMSTQTVTTTMKNTTTTTFSKTETTTTINVTTTVVNTTTTTRKPLGRRVGDRYNWWQILMDSGGKPGTLKGRNGAHAQNQRAPSVNNPCDRPLEVTSRSEFSYAYLDSDFKTYYRQEVVYPRFQGTPSYFSDVRGYLVWVPPKDINDTHIYATHYILDDIGFWVHVDILF